MTVESVLKGLNYGLKPALSQYKFGVDPVNKRSMFAVDQAKYNFAWLNYPELEEKGLSILSDEFIDHVHETMDKKTRSALCSLPLTFMKYWDGLHSKAVDMPVLAQVLDDGYFGTMQVQAHRAQARLIEKEGNVLRPPFRR